MRILFVDDDPLVLMLLQRQLRARRTEWEMEFVGDGHEALALMAVQPAEIVVSDLRMPGMNGVELLSEVRQRYPQTIRLIHSGDADSQLVFSSAGCAHQFLSKPCEAEIIDRTLARVARVQESLGNHQLRALLSRMEGLPSVPAVYCAMMEALRHPGTTIADLGTIIARDPAMTVQMLKLTNSAFFGLRYEVVDPVEALSFLGIDLVKSLVLMAHMNSHGEKHSLPEGLMERLWKHGLETAAIARAIAKSEGADLNTMNAAAVAGMLHDVGKLILASNLGGEYRKVLEMTDGRVDLIEAESYAFGATHADVGGHLLELWGLPVAVVEAIALHHVPARGAVRGFTPLMAVHVANGLAYARNRAHSGRPSAPWDIDWLSDLGFDDRLEAWKQLDLADLR